MKMGIDQLPPEILSHILNYVEIKVPYLFVCHLWKEIISYLCRGKDVYQYPYIGKITLTSTHLAARNDLYLLKWVHLNKCPINWYETFAAASIHGNIEMFEYLHSNGGAFDCKAIEISCLTGNEAAFKWFLDKLGRFPIFAPTTAIIGGNLNILKIVMSKVTINTKWIIIAVKYGHLEIFKWLWEHIFLYDYLDHLGFSSDLQLKACYKKAVKNGHLHILEWLWKNYKPPYLGDICTSAAGKGQLETLKWLQEKGYRQYTNYTSAIAAKNNHFHVLKWLRENRCPWDENTFIEAIKVNNMEMIEWLKIQGCPFDNKTLSVVKSYDIFKKLVQWGCPIDEITFASAVEYGFLDRLKWLKEFQCRWNEETFRAGIYVEDLEILEWLKNNNCPYDEEDLWIPIENDMVQVLRWLDQNNYYWPKNIEN
jgi:hypothetical protein